MEYSWHSELWERLLGRIDRLPHAILLSGQSGGGKREFAQALASRLLCEVAQGQEQACGQCASCNWFFAKNHPDFRLIEPEADDSGEDPTEAEPAAQKKKSNQIRIDQIRDLDGFLGIGTHRQGKRLIVIQPAEAMNPATANALLKILEEPSASTLFILITNNKRRLLPTLLSRCQILDFPKPAITDALAWLRKTSAPHADDLLAHAGGMPLAALKEAGSWDRLVEFYRDLAQLEQTGPVFIAGRWEVWLKENREEGASIDKRTLVTWMQKWVFDLAISKLGGQPIYHRNKSREIRDTARQASINSLIECYNDLIRIQAVSQHPLNPRLFLEDMLSRYARATQSRR